MNSMPKIKLELLNRLVAELTQTLKDAEEVMNNKALSDQEQVQQYVVDMSKAQGLASGISQEAAFVAGDCVSLIKNLSTPPDTLGSLLSSLAKKKPADPLTEVTQSKKKPPTNSN